jgi:hypothetical protein
VSNPTQLLFLNCFVFADQPHQTFTVKIPNTENVSILEKMIKEEKSPHFNHVAASDLVLSQAPQPKESLSIVDHTPLDPFLPLSKLFCRVEENRLHIVIQAPPKGHSISVVSDIITDFAQSARRMRKKKRREMGLLL